MTDDLNELRRLLAVISPLPWWVEPARPTLLHGYKRTLDAYIACGDGYDVIERYDVDTDYAYIVAAVNAVPRLLDRLLDLENREANYLTYGQGGAEYWEAQYVDQLRGYEERAERAEARADATQAILIRALDESGHTKFCRAYQDIGDCDCWYGEAWALASPNPTGGTDER